MPIEKFKPTYTFTEDRLDQLKQVVPEAFADGKINWNTLKEALGEFLEDEGAEAEHFGLTWPGKRQARRLAALPSKGALTACPEEGIDAENSEHVFIEGDNLEVLKLMQKAYAGRVKLIYIDPPYNTGNDFVYKDDYSEPLEDYLRKTGQKSDGGELLTSNPKSSGRFHSNWLNMMYPRLRLARNLLTEDGCIFISIDNNELNNLISICFEIFGEENYQANISWQKRYTRSNNTVDFTTVVEHIVVFSKSSDFIVNLLDRTEDADNRYANPDNDPRGPWKGASFLNPATPQQRPNLCYPIKNPNTGTITNPTTNAWRRKKSEFDRLQSENRLYWGRDGAQSVPSIKMFLSEARGLTPIDLWDHEYAGNTDEGTKDLAELLGEKVFDNPKPIKLIERVLEHGAKKDSIVLDFFAGSGTTGNAVINRNIKSASFCRYILIQIPEYLNPENNSHKSAALFCKKHKKPQLIAEITKERLRRAAKKVQEGNPDYTGDLGFQVFKLGPSQFRAWEDVRIQDLQQMQLQFEATEQPLIDNWNFDTVFYEILLQEGFPLHSNWGSLDKADQEVLIVSEAEIEHRLFVCLEDKLNKKTIKALTAALDDNDILVCFDRALTDETKAQLADRVRLRVL